MMYIYEFSSLLPWLQPTEPTLETLHREEFFGYQRAAGRGDAEGEPAGPGFDVALLEAESIVRAAPHARIA